MRRKLDAHPREIENCRDPPNLMVVRHYGLEVERIEQLTLLTLAPPHHRNSPSMADSPRRNHGSLCSSRQFCNKIGQNRNSRAAGKSSAAALNANTSYIDMTKCDEG